MDDQAPDWQRRVRECAHTNKRVTDTFNMDGEVYYDCPDCGAGWRQEPETEDDAIAADRILDIDLEALGIERPHLD